jgi:aryl-alcohol dehydrogenase-like predicted oxidoreductase
LLLTLKGGSPLETRRIGRIEVSLAGLGCNNFGRRLDARGTRKVVEAALEMGVRHFDTADVYSEGASETLLGQALGPRREDVVITTKFGMREPPEGLSGGHPTWVKQACAESLRRLGSDYVDLYLLHQPDPEVPITETLAAMNDLIAQGKVREIGCSNFSASQLDEAAEAAKARGLRPFACVQNEYSLLHREPEQAVLERCASLGPAFVPFFPLAMGLLAGKYRQGRPLPAGTRLTGADDPEAETFVAERLAAVERLASFAERRGHSLLELALGWLADQEQIASVIAGAMTAEQVAANVAATTAWELTDGELAEVDRLTAGA